MNTPINTNMEPEDTVAVLRAAAAAAEAQAAECDRTGTTARRGERPEWKSMAAEHRARADEYTQAANAIEEREQAPRTPKGAAWLTE